MWWHLAEAGHLSILWSGSDQVEMDGLSGLDFKTTMQAGFACLGLKNGGGGGGVSVWPDSGNGRHVTSREGCVEAKQSHENGVSNRSSDEV